MIYSIASSFINPFYALSYELKAVSNWRREWIFSYCFYKGISAGASGDSVEEDYWGCSADCWAIWVAKKLAFSTLMLKLFTKSHSGIY